MKIKDIEITRYENFINKTTFEQTEDTYWLSFEKVLKAAVSRLSQNNSYADGIQNTDEGKIEKKNAKEGHFVRLLRSKGEKGSYVKLNDCERKLVAGIFLDAYIIKETVYRQLNAESDENNLKKNADQVKKIVLERPQAGYKLPADCFAYFVETDQIRFDKTKIFESLLGADAHPFYLGHSFFSISVRGNEAIAVIIPNTNSELENHKIASEFYGTQIQDYFLSFTKVVHQIHSIKQLEAKKTRAVLIKFLKWLDENPPATLSQIEYANRKLTEYRANLADKIISIKESLHTIDVNIRNARNVLENKLWNDRKYDLEKIMIEPLTHQFEQAKVDLEYLQFYDEKAQIQEEEIANKSNLQSGVYGRKLAWFFGLLSLIGALQLFPYYLGDRQYELLISLMIAVPLAIAVIFFSDFRDFLSKIGLLPRYQFNSKAESDQPPSNNLDNKAESAPITASRSLGEQAAIPAQMEFSATENIKEKS